MTDGQVLYESIISSKPTYRVLVPFTHPMHVRYLMTIACAIAKSRGGDVLIAHFMELADTHPESSAKRYFERFKKLLDEAEEYGKELGVEVGTIMKISKNATKGIWEIIEEKLCNIMVLGWKEDTKPQDRCFGTAKNRLISNSKCDVIMIKMVELGDMRRILTPISRGQNSTLALEISAIIANVYKGAVTACIIVRPNLTTDKRELYDKNISEKISKVEREFGFKIEKKIIESKSIAESILKESDKYDGIVLGSSMRGFLNRILFKTVPEILSEKSKKTIIMAKKYLPS